MTDTLISEKCRQSLANYQTIFVGFSGGLDSTVLLHHVVDFPELISKLRVVHIHHGLSDNADSWQAHCEAFCKALDIPLLMQRVELEGRVNIEDSARTARYQVFSSLLAAHDCLLLAHHGDDQAETLLLQLLRGAGVDGMAAMLPITPFAHGKIIRPLLQYSRQALEAYAQAHDLTWVEDESNQNIAFSRNYLRHQIMPLLQEKWPGAARNLARSAMHCQQAKVNLEALAALDCEGLMEPHDTLLLTDSLLSLGPHRLANALRFWLKKNKIRLPSATVLGRLIDEVIFASPDAMPVVTWGDCAVRRYQHRLYLLSRCRETLKSIMSTSCDLFAGSRNSAPGLDPASKSRDVGEGDKAEFLISRQRLLNEAVKTPQGQMIEWSTFPASLLIRDYDGVETYVSASLADKGLIIPKGCRIHISFRQGGELFYWRGQTKSLKKLLQQWQVPPWRRDLVPLLYIDGLLAAVVGFATSDRFYGAESGRAYCIHTRVCYG